MTAVEQPSGTVTLVFSDIEGSTRLLDELGTDAYREALREHRRIVREAYGRYSGYEVDYEGDAFFYTFASATDAVAAVSAAMAGLEPGPIAIRVGVHTGTPGLDPPKYVGMDVHFAARVMGSAHGGQVVLSPATAKLVEAELHELGEHRLKDIAEAVPLFQLGEGSFPPLKTISNTNLPRPASSFLGREAELQEVVSRIEQGARLVTLTGPGGTGKTRLALEAATSLVPSYKAGVFWVGLAALRDPALVTETIAQVLGAKEDLASHIAAREMLLLLDNVEQVIASAPALSELVQACPNLTLLVTSRELLRISGEVEYAVPPLAEPEAVSLFCERSQLEPSEEIAELCARLDSLPLAVELAAARTKALSVAQILERLAQRLDLLKGGRDADPRQQTLRATIEWSYELLSPAEQQLFARLSVFAGGCTLEAAEEVAAADLDILQSLVEKSLVRFANERYWMLETIREFAVERLATSDGTRRRHADYYREFAVNVDRELRGDHDNVLLDELAREHENVRALLTWSLAQDPALGMETAIAMGRFWWMRGHTGEQRRWLGELVHLRTELTADLLANGLAELAYAAGEQGDLPTVVSNGEEALELARGIGADDAAYRALDALAYAYSSLGRGSEAEAAYDEARALARRSGNPYREAASAYNAGIFAQSRGDLRRARVLIEEALELSRRIGSQEGVASSLLGLGSLLRDEGRLDESLSMLREALVEISRLGFPVRSAVGVLEIATVLSLTGEPERAARLFGAAEAVFAAADVEIDDISEDIEAGLKLSLGESDFERLRAEGSETTLQDAVELALASID